MEKLNLVEILKNVPEGTKLWSNHCGTVIFHAIDTSFHNGMPDTPIITSLVDVTPEGKIDTEQNDAECILWPSKEIRDWSRWEEELKWREIEQWIADGVCEMQLANGRWVSFPEEAKKYIRNNSNILLDFRKKPEVNPWAHLNEALLHHKLEVNVSDDPKIENWILLVNVTYTNPKDFKGFSRAPEKYRIYNPHQYLIDAIAEGKQIEWNMFKDKRGNWSITNKIDTSIPIKCYRIYDPYRELKEAYERGEIIERNVDGFGWKRVYEAHWDADLTKYRIKPKEPKYIPFTFEDRDIFRGSYVKFKENTTEYLITTIQTGGVKIDQKVFGFNDAFERLTFLDGTPFGKLVDHE